MLGKRSVGCAAFATLLLAGCGAHGSDAPRGGAAPTSGRQPSSIVSPAATQTGGAARSTKRPLAWVENYQAVCVSLVRGVPPKRALRLLTGGDVRSLAGQADAEHWIDAGGYDRYWIAVGRIGKWTFLWEDNGYDGSLPRIARRLSVGTSFVSFYWNVNSVEQFSYASRGRVVRAFDPVLDKRNGGVGRPLLKEAGLRWRTRPEVSMVRLQASIARTPVANPSWLSRPGVTFWGSHL
jgi:Family of unknown function (DUF6461)